MTDPTKPEGPSPGSDRPSGSRIHIPNLPARDAAAKYCDIVSYNVYRKDVSVYPEDGLNADTLIKSADLALYEAKRAGKNAYRIAD